MIHVEAIDHLVLRTTQLDAMLEFYVHVLGCTLEKTQEDIGLYQLRAGSGLIDLLRVSEPAPKPKQGLDHFCLRLAHFDERALIGHLRARGVEPGEVHERYGAQGSGPSMYIRDPNGNTVELKAPRPSTFPSGP